MGWSLFSYQGSGKSGGPELLAARDEDRVVEHFGERAEVRRPGIPPVSELSMAGAVRRAPAGDVGPRVVAERVAYSKQNVNSRGGRKNVFTEESFCFAKASQNGGL